MADEFDRLDDFDLDLEDDDLLDAGDEGGLFGEEDAIPKRKVSEIVKKRLAKERDRQRKLNESIEKFSKVYGMSIDEAVEFALREQQRLAGNQQQQQTGVTQPVQQPAIPPGITADPVAQKVFEIDNWRREFEERQQREREAMEFVQKYPDVKFEDIPREVLERRARGGVTLAEAYKLYMADKQAAEAAKKAAESTARNIKSRNVARSEGADYGAGASDATAFLDEEERQFAKLYGMTPKEYLAYKMKASKFKEGE